MQFVVKRRWRLLILGVALALILISRSFLYVNFVQPIALFLWAAWRVMASVNQNVFWTLLLTGGLIPLIWMIFSAKGSVARSAYHQEPLPPGRVEHWEFLLSGANSSQKSRERLREEWGELLQSVMAHSNRADTVDYSGGDNTYIESLPEGLRRIVKPAGRRESVPQIQRILQLLPESVRPRLERNTKTDDRWIRESLRWMESELDIPYDD
jgi:hypothetical protein